MINDENAGANSTTTADAAARKAALANASTGANTIEANNDQGASSSASARSALCPRDVNKDEEDKKVPGKKAAASSSNNVTVTVPVKTTRKATASTSTTLAAPLVAPSASARTSSSSAGVEKKIKKAVAPSELQARTRSAANSRASSNLDENVPAENVQDQRVLRDSTKVKVEIPTIGSRVQTKRKSTAAASKASAPKLVVAVAPAPVDVKEEEQEDHVMEADTEEEEEGEAAVNTVDGGLVVVRLNHAAKRVRRAVPAVVEAPVVETRVLPVNEQGGLAARALPAVEHDDLDADDAQDPMMVSEYVEEIFDYLRELEVSSMAKPNYMDNQRELQWKMRSILVDWLIEVHTKFRLLPETLFLAVNIIDRFLSLRVVSLVKLQLVGVTALFIASKYEEVMSPSISSFLYMAEDGYTEEEIVRAERYVLQVLKFNMQYPTPMSFLRRSSKADDYDIQTRTLAKYLMEITLLDHRFLGITASMVAAASHYLARYMLDRGSWNKNLAHYSGYTEAELEKPTTFMLEFLMKPVKYEAIYKKYSQRKFMKGAFFVRDWIAARVHAVSELKMRLAVRRFELSVRDVFIELYCTL